MKAGSSSDNNRIKRYLHVERGIELDVRSHNYRGRTTDYNGRVVSGYARTLEESRKWLTEARAACKAKLPPPPSPMRTKPESAAAESTPITVAEYWATWKVRKESAAKSGIRKGTRRRQEIVRPDTLSSYDSTMRNRVLPFIAGKILAPPKLGGISKDDILRMRDCLAERGYAQASQNSALVLINRLLDEAIDEGIELINVARSVRPVEPKHPMRKWNPHGAPLPMARRIEAARALPPELQAGGLLAAVVALRAGETCGMQLDDLDLWGEHHGHVGWVRLRQQRRARKAEDGRWDETVGWLKHGDDGVDRDLPLPPTLVEYLRWYVEKVAPGYRQGDPRGSEFLVRGPRRRSKPGEYVYPKMSAGSWSEVFKRAMERTEGLRYADLGFAVTPHTEREDCLSELKAKVDDYIRSAFAGHSQVDHVDQTRPSSRVTDNAKTYSKVAPAELIPVADAIEALLQEATGGLGLIVYEGLIVHEGLTAFMVAHRAGASRTVVQNLAANGDIVGEKVKVPGQGKPAWRFDESAVEQVRKLVRGPEDGCRSVREGARILGISITAIYGRLEAGRVPSARQVPADRYCSGSQWRLPPTALEELAASIRGAVLPPREEWEARTLQRLRQRGD